MVNAIAVHLLLILALATSTLASTEPTYLAQFELERIPSTLVCNATMPAIKNVAVVGVSGDPCDVALQLLIRRCASLRF